MKLSLMRPALVLALALGLASCGGKAGFTIAGEVSGLKYTGLKLSTNGMTIAVEPPAASATTVKFAFPDDIEYGEVYNVLITQQPAHQTCGLDYTSTNTAGRLSTINVNVACVLNSSSVAGTVKGLTGTGLQLTNGSTSGIITVVPSTTGTDPAFSFANIPYNQAYGITVLTQPTGQVCSVSANGVGVMDDDGDQSVVVDCK
ncbi:MAG TPA: hypothetical protein VF861_06735 [Telluria sp.]